MYELFIPNEGLLELLGYLIGRSSNSGESFLLDLYQNQVTVGPTTTYGDFEICNFVGYAQVRLAPSAFGLPTIDVNDNAVSSYNQNPVSWINNGIQQAVWGFVISSASTGNVLWVAQFPIAILVLLNQTFSVTVNLTLGNAGGPT